MTANAATKKNIGTKKTSIAYLLDNGFKTRTITATVYSNHTATAKAPNIAGHKPSATTIKYKVDKKGELIQLTDLIYVKNTQKFAYKFGTLKSQKTKSKKSVKVTGNAKVATKSLAKKHKATVVCINTNVKKTYVKLSKKGTFSKVVKIKNDKYTSAVLCYYSKGRVFHELSNKKQVAIKAYK